MNLNHYIIISILFHLLLVVFMGVTHSTTKDTPEIFNVNIVPPPETEKPPVIKKIPLLKRKLIPPIIKTRRRPIPKKVTPDNMYGTGTSHDSKGPDSKSSSKKTAKDKDQDKEQDIFRAFTSDKLKQLPKDKDGSTIVPPSTLFDKKTIEKFAKKGPDASKGLSFDTSGFKHRGYMRMLKERIENLWKYPKDAARSKLSGDLRIKFVIKKDGTLESANIVRTSGHISLDEAAIKALEKASPYWPLPDDWEGETLEITGHFIYVYGITHVM